MKSDKIVYLLLGLILSVHSLILVKLIFFPYPELFIYPYLTNHGLKPYSQILDQHFPGLMFLPVNFDNLGMNNEISARIWLIAVMILTQLLLFWAASSLLKSNSKALLVNILYLIWQPFFEGWVLWIDNFLPLFLLPAFIFCYKKKFFLTGLLIGIGVVFKQTVLPLTLLILCYIVWSEKKLKMGVNFLLGLILPVGLMILYLGYSGILADFWYWTIVFNLTVYAASGTQIPQSFGFFSRVIFVYVASLLGVLHFNRRIKAILLLFLAGSFAGTFDRANFVHLQPSLPFVALGTTLGFFSLTKKKIILLLTGGYLIVTIWWQIVFYKGHLSDKVFFFDDATYALANKIKQYTTPGEKIFVFGAAPHLYQLSDTLPAGDIFVFQFPWFLQVAGDRVLAGIKLDQPKIIVTDRSSKIEGYKITDYASGIDQYIENNYQKIDNIGTAEILQRK